MLRLLLLLLFVTVKSVSSFKQKQKWYIAGALISP